MLQNNSFSSCGYEIAGIGQYCEQNVRTLLDDDNDDDFFHICQRCQFKFEGVNYWNIPNLIKCSSVTLKPGWEVS